MNPALSSLLLDLGGLSDEQAEQKTYQEYIRFYTNRRTHRGMIGVHKTHDEEDVIFFEDRFEHAFFSSAQGTYRQYAKDKFQRSRAIRVRWIGPVIQGCVEGTECWKIFSNQRYHSDAGKPSRLYIVWHERYLVWLEPRKKGDWWFSSAYVAERGRRYISRITQNGVCLWRKEIPRD